MANERREIEKDLADTATRQDKDGSKDGKKKKNKRTALEAQSGLQPASKKQKKKGQEEGEDDDGEADAKKAPASQKKERKVPKKKKLGQSSRRLLKELKAKQANESAEIQLQGLEISSEEED